MQTTQMLVLLLITWILARSKDIIDKQEKKLHEILILPNSL